MNFENGVIVSVARSDHALEELLSENKRVLYFSDYIQILPEHYVMPVKESIAKRLDELNDFDVVEFYSESRFQVYFRSASTDNALMVTSKCNSNCIMCPMPEAFRKGPSYEILEHLCELVKYMPSDTPFLTITGGEPTLIKEDIFPLLECIRDHFEGTKFFFLTNGRTLSKKEYLVRFLNSMPEPFRFCIPLYGYDEVTHDTITQAKGSFKQTVIALHELLNHRCEIEIRIVVSKLNAHFMTKTAQYIARHFKGITSVNIMATEMCGAAAVNREAVWLDYYECFRQSKEAIHILMTAGIDVQLYNFPLCKVDREYWALCARSISDYKIRYNPDCCSCSVVDVCGGVFNTTLALTKMELKPIGGNYD